ncbi:hypothetical protein EUTSA_v10018961mg [Eutrema salsugineum]|uniref:Protein TIFY n=1 Tax=Eutrema salsugineum TaxID=72664 RepID=V4KE96_EUTSA|nr:hypothetical protein EUTSA_v10018961mg [Eutrema salsugineum]
MMVSENEEAKAFPGSYQWGSVSTASSVYRRGQLGGAFQNANPLLLGGSVPLTNHSSLRPAFNSPADPRVASSGSSHQLTILYAGTVSVFNDISPDKAQAIMLCAGNGLGNPRGENGESSLKKPLGEAERIYGKQTHNVVVAAAASSSSATNSDHSFPRCRDNNTVAATNAMSMIESFNAGPGNMIPSVPQARKASLARFLEKRKERLMSAMPYKKMLLDLSTGESTGMNYSSTSPA